jgi:hypothetical protein
MFSQNVIVGIIAPKKKFTFWQKNSQKNIDSNTSETIFETHNKSKSLW